MPSVHIGLTEQQRKGVIDILNRDLSDAYVLVVKVKKFHWDVVGSQFLTLHKLWDEQYETISENIDACAERIRALGGFPAGSMRDFLNMTTLKEHTVDVPSATEMVKYLIKDHEQIVRNLRQHVDLCSKEFGDQGTADFLTGLMKQHEHIAWTLRSFLD